MKLHDRFLVPGTDPAIYIGHRFFKDKKTGDVTVCKKWHAEFALNGRKFHEPLKTKHKQDAIRAAHKIMNRLERGEVRKVQQKVEWEQMRDAYIDFIRSKNRAPKTLGKYEYVIGRFMTFAKEAGCMSPDRLTPTVFWQFNSKMLADDLHLKTIEDRLVIVKQWYKWATVRAKPPLLNVNPLAAEEIEEAESSPQPCFTPEQVATLLANADQDHEGPVYAVMAYLGLRFGEVRDLRWSDFDFTQGTHGWVNVQRGGSSKRTKGKASRRIPLNEELRKVLDRLTHAEDGRLFHQRPSKKYPEGGRPLSGEKLLKSLKRLCKRCKFPNPEQYKVHTFRHGFASMLARSNVGYKQALSWLGHKDSKILDLYITMFDPDAERAIRTVNYATPMTAS